MSHTKRSTEFQMRLNRLVEKVLSNTLDNDERVEVADLLRINTTNSSCMVKAAMDEPVFVIRAKDPLSVYTVNYWCQQAKERSLHEKLKIEDAAQAGLDMAQWRLENGLK